MREADEPIINNRGSGFAGTREMKAVCACSGLVKERVGKLCNLT